MKIFVTGPNGFLGKHVVQALLDAGHEAEPYLRKQAPLPDDLRDFDAVYHLAGVLGKDSLTQQDYAAAHVDLTRELMRRMDYQQKFVYMSTAYVLGQTSHVHYVSTKLEGERIVRKFFDDPVILRPGPLFGPGDWHHFPLYKAINRLGSLCPIPGNALVSPIDVRDVARALARPETLHGTVHMAGDPLPAGKLMRCIAETLGRYSPWFQLPKAVKIKPDFFRIDHSFPNDLQERTPLKQLLQDSVHWYKLQGAL